MSANLVVPDICDYPVVHPAWCTKKHVSGALSRRQFHDHTWRSTHGKSLAMKIELHPFRGSHVEGPSVTVITSVTDPEPNRYAGTVLTVLGLGDVRSLIASLQQVADAIEDETIAYADANGFDCGELGVTA